MPASIDGVNGSITWAYYEAARLEGYRVARFEGVWSMRGRMVLHDAFKLKQSPLIFVAPIAGGKRWRWPIESIRVDGPIVYARLGPPIEG